MNTSGIECTEYTLLDKVLLAHLRCMLDACNIPSSYGIPSRFCSHAKRIGANYQPGACQLLVALKNTASMSVIANVSRGLKTFIMQHCPGNMYDMVQINKNCVSKPHQDSGNIGESTLVGLGTYTGGDTILHLDSGSAGFDISKLSVTFRAQDILHSSESFEGLRYSLVFFRQRKKGQHKTKVKAKVNCE